MFNLMSNFCKWVCKLQQPTRNITVLVVGLDRAGKTLCIRGMLRAPLGDEGSTNGCARYELRLENILVNILDIGGSPEFRVRWREYYGEAHGVIFVVDSSDRHRMKEVKAHLMDMLRHPRLAGKPLLLLANKQDRMNALLGSELIEVLSLEKLVNQSQSLCHIEPCSALMDLQRWSDRKTLRGLRWLLRAVSLDYTDLCARVVRDGKGPAEQQEKERKVKAEKSQRKNKVEWLRANNPDFHTAQCPLEEEQKSRSHLQPSILKKNSFQENLKKNKLKVKIKTKSVKMGSMHEEVDNEEEGKNVQGHDGFKRKDKASSASLLQKSGRLKPKTKVETLDNLSCQESKPSEAGRGQRKTKKKLAKGNRKNRINTEKIPISYRQPAELATTFDLYRQAILALKARQDERLMAERWTGNTMGDDTEQRPVQIIS